MFNQEENELSTDCIRELRVIRDTMELLSGKWKIQIISVLQRGGTMRFTELKKCLNGIASKKLANDLHDLELNKLVLRNVKSIRPFIVEYSITEHGGTLECLIEDIINWGDIHRDKIINS